MISHSAARGFMKIRRDLLSERSIEFGNLINGLQLVKNDFVPVGILHRKASATREIRQFFSNRNRCLADSRKRGFAPEAFPRIGWVGSFGESG